MLHPLCANGAVLASGVEYTAHDEAAFICGNSLVLQRLSITSQRIVRGTSFGIQAFAVNRKRGLIALAEKGPTPAILIYSVSDLQLLGSLQLGFLFGFTCLAFSTDGERLAVGGEDPDTRVAVYTWRKAEHIVTADLPKESGAAAHISFHPYDSDRLATTLITLSAGQGTTLVWHIRRLWDRCEISSKKVLLDVNHSSSTHAWFPGGLYVGAASGHLYAALMNPPSAASNSAPLTSASAAVSTYAPASRVMSARTNTTHTHALEVPQGSVDEDGADGGAKVEGEEVIPADIWVAELMLDAWGTGQTPITTLAVSRGVVAVGGPDEVLWFTHPRAMTDDEFDEGNGLNALGSVKSTSKGVVWGWWRMRLCGRYDVGLGCGVVALAYGRHDSRHGECLVGTGDGRVLVLELGDMVQALEEMEQQQQQAAASESLAQHSDPSIGGLLQLQQLQQKEEEEQQQQQGAEDEVAPASYTGMPPTHVQVLVDSHVGSVGGLAAHPDEGGMVTCGADGTLRLWGLKAGSGGGRGTMCDMLEKRVFSSAQTCLAVAPLMVNKKMALAGVGSETGVLRLVALPSAQRGSTLAGGAGDLKKASSHPIQVLWRRRLHRGPMHCIAFSPDGSMLATAGKDNALWFLSLNRDGTALPLGQVVCPGEILSVAWPEVHGVDDGVLVSLAAGAIACVRAPIELHAASRPTVNDHLMLGPPDVTTQVVRVESPLLAMLPVGGPLYGEVYGIGVDQMVHRIMLPQDEHDWTGLRARPLRSIKRVCVHQRQQSAISAPPSCQLLATACTDGTLVLLDPSLNSLNSQGEPNNAPGSGSPSRDGSNPQSRPNIVKTNVSEEEEAATQTGYRGVLVLGMHGVLDQGVAALAFDSSGKYLVSCGHDGSMFVYEPRFKGHTIEPAHLVGSLVVMTLHDADGFDEEDEPLEADGSATSRPASTPARQPQQVTSGGPSIEKRLWQLRDALAVCTARNEAAPDLEKVSRADFIIDRGLVNELKAKADASVKESRKLAQHEAHVMEVITARIRAMCWDAMTVRGMHISPITTCSNNKCGNVGLSYPINLPPAVHNFPLLESTKRQRQLAQVLFLRQVEIMEWRDTGTAYADSFLRLNAEESSHSITSFRSDVPSPKGPSKDASQGSITSTVKDGPGPEVQQSPDGNRSLRPASDAGGLGRSRADRWTFESLDDLMYSSFDLHSPTRKITQAQFLLQKAHELKLQFNKDWEKLWKQKASDMDKITDLNARLEDTLRDLVKLEAPFSQPLEQLQIPVSFPEDMSNVLKVQDNEVKDCIKLEHKEGCTDTRYDRGNSLNDAVDSALDRGLRQMMGGTLASKQKHDQVYTLTKPEWMEGNPAYFTPMQQREVQEFKLQEKALAEERAKQINMLEVEVRTLRSTLEVTASNFDQQLKVLATQRHAIATDIGAYEVAILGLAASLQAAADAGEHKEQEAVDAMAAANETRTRVAIELSGKKRALTEVEAPLPELYAHEKALDRNFKKEFADAEHLFGRLHQLYKMRLVASPFRHPPAHSSPTYPQHSSHTHQGGPSSQASAPAHMRAGAAPDLTEREQHHKRSQSQILPARDSLTQPQQQQEAEVRPPSPLTTLVHHPLVAEAQESTGEPWPDLPSSLAATIISSSLQPGTLPPSAPHEPEVLGDHYKPEGLDAELWRQFEAHRGARVRGEAEGARLEACCSCLRSEIKSLEETAFASTTASTKAMQQIQQLQTTRQTALLDVELQLRLKAGQMEVGVSAAPEESGGLLAGMEDALFVHRSVVENVNEHIRQRAIRNVGILNAIKEFKKGIHMLEWDHRRCDMLMADTLERVRDLQLLHVTRDMHAVFREGESAASGTAAAAAVETSNLEALAKQHEKLHKKALQERAREFKAVKMEIMERAERNGEIGRHLLGLSQVLEEQRRLRASMGSMDDGARRMRSLVTHKKLKEIALAQADEVRALAAELDSLRQHTYPTFIEPVTSGPADFRPADSHRASLRASGGSLRGKHLTKSLGRLF